MELENILRLCHDYRVRKYRDENVRLEFAEDAFMEPEPIVIEPSDEAQNERELMR